MTALVTSSLVVGQSRPAGESNRRGIIMVAKSIGEL